jgi:hypothetical protein
MNFDRRFSIFDFLTRCPTHRCFATGDKDSGELIRFAKQGPNSFGRQQARFDDYLQPEATLVSLLLNNGRLVNEIGARLCAAEGAVIGADRASAPDKLIRDDVAATTFGNCVGKLKHAQREFFGSLFHLCFVHAGF